MIEVLKQALDALETELFIDWTNNDEFNASAEKMHDAITSLQQAIKELESQEPVTSSIVECVMSARKEFSAIKGESQFCTECHAFEKADSWWQEWHGGDIDYITGAKYAHPPQRTEQEPVQVSPLEFVEMVMEKEHLIGKPIFWAEWPNKEKNNA